MAFRTGSFEIHWCPGTHRPREGDEMRVRHDDGSEARGRITTVVHCADRMRVFYVIEGAELS